MSKALLIVFAKAPVPGRVKTRLVPPLTAEQAAAVYEAALRDVIAGATAVTRDTLVLYDDAPASAAFFSDAFPDVPRQPQAGGDLGERLTRAFQDAFDAGADSATIIGSDSPTLPRAVLEDGLRAADAHDVVLGPAFDGGYYLVGLQRAAWPAARRMFRDVAWSTGEVLRQTLTRLAPTRLDVHLLSSWYDIDRIHELRVAAVDAAPDSALRGVLDTLLPDVTA